MIDIDFVAGSHGNYLEFILNKCVYGDKIAQALPFNALGASHGKDKNTNYRQHKLFNCGHWFQIGGGPNKEIISIRFTGDDLMSLMTVSSMRAGDMAIADTDLHIDTYHKLNNRFYKSLLDNIRTSYADTIVAAYNNVRGENWPDIKDASDFKNLPEIIQEECLNDYGFKVYPLTGQYPDFDRALLREFFKFGFGDVSVNGFMKEQERMQYAPGTKVYEFPFTSFYKTESFLKEISNIRDFFNLTFSNFDAVPVHAEFLSRQYHVNFKKNCDDIIDAVREKKKLKIDKLTLFQESYINAHLELIFKKEMPSTQAEYFTNTHEILEYLNEI